MYRIRQRFDDAKIENLEQTVDAELHGLSLTTVKPGQRVAITGGPPIMIKFVLQALEKLGYTPEQVITTLEMRMKCGVGKCGRCNIGPVYVCKEGPVFSLAELNELPAEY